MFVNPMSNWLHAGKMRANLFTWLAGSANLGQMA